MTMTKTFALAVLATMLCACSTMQSPRALAPAEFEEMMIQAMRDAYGPPIESESLPNGEQRDVFVFSDRIASRASFYTADGLSYPTSPNRSALAGHYSPTTPRFRTTTCRVEAQYGEDGVISSITAKPSRCATLSQPAAAGEDQA